MQVGAHLCRFLGSGGSRLEACLGCGAQCLGDVLHEYLGRPPKLSDSLGAVLGLGAAVRSPAHVFPFESSKVLLSCYSVLQSLQTACELKNPLPQTRVGSVVIGAWFHCIELRHPLLIF